MLIGRGSWKLSIPPVFKWGSCNSQVTACDIHKYVTWNKGAGTCSGAHNNMHVFQCSADSSAGLSPSQLLGSTVCLIGSRIWVYYLYICKKPNRCYDRLLCRFSTCIFFWYWFAVWFVSWWVIPTMIGTGICPNTRFDSMVWSWFIHGCKPCWDVPADVGPEWWRDSSCSSFTLQIDNICTFAPPSLLPGLISFSWFCIAWWYLYQVLGLAM